MEERNGHHQERGRGANQGGGLPTDEGRQDDLQSQECIPGGKQHEDGGVDNQTRWQGIGTSADKFTNTQWNAIASRTWRTS